MGGWIVHVSQFRSTCRHREGAILKTAPKANASALLCLEPWVLFIDDKNATMPTNDAAILVTAFQRFKRACDAHGASP